jgi:hypothetical protein
MTAKLIPAALLILATSMTARAEDTYAQCITSQAGYVATVRWFEEGTIKSSKSGDTVTISASKPAFKTETLNLNKKSCVGGKDTKDVAVITIKGARYVKVQVMGATSVSDKDESISAIADKSVVADTKEMFAVLQPPASTGPKAAMIALSGTVFNPVARAVP